MRKETAHQANDTESAHPSPPAPLPQGERGALAETFASDSPSPLEGEGGLSQSERSDEGCAAPLKPAGANWRHETPKRHRGFAKTMRKNPTEAERQMWLILKDRRLADYKFRRQVPMGPYIADFVCYSARLVVELDGSQHGEPDARCDAWLEAKGFSVLRFWNNQLTENRESVLDAIWHRLREETHV